MLDEMMIKINKEYGEHTCITGSEVKTHIQRLPTGIFYVDWSACGGLPLNQIACFKGPEAGGKTSAAMNVMSVASKICWECMQIDCTCSTPRKSARTLWADVEGTFDKEWCQDVGVTDDSYVLVTAEDLEQYEDIVVSAIRSEDCGLVVVDSVAALMPSKIISSSAYNSFMGVDPRAISNFVKRVSNTLIKESSAGHKVICILINQLRYKLGEMFGNPETMSGGQALKHFSSMWIRFSKKALTEPEKKMRDENRKMAMVQRHSFIIEKHKVTILGGGGEFVRCKEPIKDDAGNIEYRRGELLEYKTVLKLAKEYGVLEKDGAKWRIGEVTGTQAEIVELWKANYPAYFASQQSVIAQAKKTILGL